MLRTWLTWPLRPNEAKENEEERAPVTLHARVKSRDRRNVFARKKKEEVAQVTRELYRGKKRVLLLLLLPTSTATATTTTISAITTTTTKKKKEKEKE